MKPFPRYLAVIFCLLLLAAPGESRGGPASTAYLIHSLSLDQNDGPSTAQLLIGGNTTPIFTTYQLFDPPRVVVDIAGGALVDPVAIPETTPPGLLRSIRTSLISQEPTILRLEVALNSSEVEFAAQLQGQNIILTFKAPDSFPQPVKAIERTTAKKAAGQAAGPAVAAIIADLGKHHPPAGVEEAVRPRLPALEFHLQPRSPAGDPLPAEPAANRRNENKPVADPTLATPTLFDQDPRQISVEFFKTDLHNVFRFFGEVSQRNIVVDEGVQGNLTLTLNGVPWDFALDIVLNLKDLQKEERYNTIVISPRAKAFVWPERATDRISVRADGSMGPSDALAVRQRLEAPKEQVAARETLQRGSELDQQGAYPEALAAYEEALELWPDNTRLARRTALINLIHLGNNARALHFSRLALRHDPDDDRAALVAAIAAANMQRNNEAKEHFDRSISQPGPAAEALISYAAFAEEHDSPHGALALLERQQQLFGENLDTMITKARLLERIGATATALAEYRAILFSGYELPRDLHNYLQARIAAEGQGN